MLSKKAVRKVVQRCSKKTGLNKFVKFKNLLFNEIEGGSGVA